MRLLSWNIQWGVGVQPVDNTAVELAAIAAVVREVDADVVCLQEVCRNFPANTGAGDDQVAQLRALLPGYCAEFGAATDYVGGKTCRRQFGNMTLSKTELLSVRQFGLPMPFDLQAQRPSPRAALEVIVHGPGLGYVGVINTHLEYGSVLQRAAQVQTLADLVKTNLTAGDARGETAPMAFPPPEAEFTPITPGPSTPRWLVVGDFNCPPDSAELHALRVAGLRDAWSCTEPPTPPHYTIGVHKRLPGTVPQNFDRAYVSHALATRVVSCSALASVTASDHQPVILEIKV